MGYFMVFNAFLMDEYFIYVSLIIETPQSAVFMVLKKVIESTLTSASHIWLAFH